MTRCLTQPCTDLNDAWRAFSSERSDDGGQRLGAVFRRLLRRLRGVGGSVFDLTLDLLDDLGVLGLLLESPPIVSLHQG